MPFDKAILFLLLNGYIIFSTSIILFIIKSFFFDFFHVMLTITRNNSKKAPNINIVVFFEKIFMSIDIPIIVFKGYKCRFISTRTTFAYFFFG